jgi:carbon-monoxide dehydrogenase medium subunit
MKPAPFTYCAAQSAQEAAALLRRLGDEARIIAGGQSLGPMLNLRVARPSHLVDVSRIAALRELYVSDGALCVGAAVTHADIEDAALPGVSGDILTTVAAGIAYRSVRNRGTIGGSMAHADPAADWPPVLCALDARVRTVTTDGGRRIAARGFFQGYFETALTPGEVLAEIEVPQLAPGARWALAKEVQSHGGFASAIAICVMTPDEKPRLWLGAAEPCPLDRSDVIADLEPRAWSDVTKRMIEERIATGLDDPDDDGALARYRRRLHAVNAARAVERAIAS